jgi:acetyl-CoA synthetase
MSEVSLKADRGSSAAAFLAARDFLLRHRDDADTARRDFRWPQLDHFNWALDHFDAIARGNDAPALWIVNETGAETVRSFREMSERSSQVANHLRSLGVRRGDRILLMLGNELALWEVMLAAIKLGAVMIPASSLLTPDDLRDRIERGDVRHVVAASEQVPKFAALTGAFTRICVGAAQDGWQLFDASEGAPVAFTPDGPTRADDPLLLYFTSGTTAQPKLVLHTHQSYPVGHLTTMYWIGLKPGDVHLNISSPGWAKHAWSCFFAPWNADACIFHLQHARFQAQSLLGVLARCKVTEPVPHADGLAHADPGRPRGRARSAQSARGDRRGEPLNPEIIEQVRSAWGLTLRDGYGQTETTALIVTRRVSAEARLDGPTAARLRGGPAERRRAAGR